MFKLIILIQPEIDQETFFDGWPEFLNHAEQMPFVLNGCNTTVGKGMKHEHEVALNAARSCATHAYYTNNS